jgi:ubiquinone/menaquinone biosynthesis C-methylase UbiE
MDTQQNYWNQYYRQNPTPTQDSWLERHGRLFDRNEGMTVLDLGCGSGSNIPFLMSKKAKIHACDYSEEALDVVKSTFHVATTRVDMRETLPYRDAQFDVVISDLSLHYFSEAVTKRIIKDIGRILKARGRFLVRLNAVQDVNHGFGEGTEIEPNFFLVDGRYKRFFDRPTIMSYFEKAFTIEHVEERKTSKYSEEKIIWEVALMKPSPQDLFRWADQIPAALWNEVLKRAPQAAAEAVGAVWEGGLFKIPLVGVDYLVDPTHQRITRSDAPAKPVSYQAGVVLLTTLAASQGVPPGGRMVVPQELPGGRMFFTGAHAIATGPLAKAFQADPEALVDRALQLGGRAMEGADVAMQVPGLPRVPLYILLWRGDQEFPARAVIGIDHRAHFHLDLAGVLALTNLLVYRLIKSDSAP